MLRKRAIISFEGRCEMNCKHCFALEQESNYAANDVNAIVDSLAKEDFDIIYVSHNKENFLYADDGVALCEKLFDRYGRDLCVTSRCVLNDEMLHRMAQLNRKMKKQDKQIFWCESAPALKSTSLMEDLGKVPSPEERICFLGRLRDNDICSILSVRPLFPSAVIPDDEIEELVKMASNKADAVITGGLITTAEIDQRLGLNREGWKYLDGNDSAYLVGAIGVEARFVDVRNEIYHLKDCCGLYGIKFFEHSLQAINALIEEKKLYV